MQVIHLNKDYAICDSELHEHLMQWNWTRKKQGNYNYATRHRKLGEDHPKELIYMHHAVLDYLGVKVAADHVIDHINRNPLDNRRGNLHVATVAENAFNSRPRGSKSGYMGVRWDERAGYWRAYLTLNGREKFICYAGDAKTAAMYRDKAIVKHYEHASLNFPEYAVIDGKHIATLPEYVPTEAEHKFLASHVRKKQQPKRGEKLST